MRQVLGKTFMGKKVVSQAGTELGHVFDMDFELDGTINYVIVKAERITREMAEHVSSANLLEIPYDNIKAVGEYVVADFPNKK